MRELLPSSYFMMFFMSHTAFALFLSHAPSEFPVLSTIATVISEWIRGFVDSHIDSFSIFDAYSLFIFSEVMPHSLLRYGRYLFSLWHMMRWGVIFILTRAYVDCALRVVLDNTLARFTLIYDFLDDSLSIVFIYVSNMFSTFRLAPRQYGHFTLIPLSIAQFSRFCCRKLSIASLWLFYFDIDDVTRAFRHFDISTLYIFSYANALAWKSITY